jgi:hypothetical protein
MKLKSFLPPFMSLVLLLSFAGCQKQGGEPTGVHIYGKIYNQNSNETVAGAMVLLSGMKGDTYLNPAPILDTCYTDEDGNYLFDYKTEEDYANYSVQAFSPRHLNPPYNQATWEHIYHQGKVHESDHYITPICWLKINSMKVSNADALSLNRMIDRDSDALIVEPRVIFFRKARGNQEVVLPFFRWYQGLSIPLPIPVQTPAHDTLEVLVEW